MDDLGDPNCRPSRFPIWTTERVDNPDEILMVIEVYGLGVITLHAVDGEFRGVGIFTVQEIKG